MRSAEDLAASIIAVELYNSNLKSDIFCSSSSCTTEDYNLNRYEAFAKIHWTENIEEIAGECLENLRVPEGSQDKVVGIVHCVALRLLNWIVYHEYLLGISREFCINFMKSSFFTSGIIDNRKVAEELLKEESLSTGQKFKLACLYSLSDIPALYKLLQGEDATKIFEDKPTENIRQTKLHNIWFHVMDLEAEEKENFLKSCLLKESVKSGSLPAVKFCLDNMYDSGIWNGTEWNLVSFALIAVKRWVKAGNEFIFDICYDDRRSWIPRECYIDILCLLLSKMSTHEKITFLKEDLKNEGDDDENITRSRVLQMFLGWPYQHYFMRTANLMWDFLPEESYAVLLLQICDRICPSDYGFNYGTERTFDYRKLLIQFWEQSANRYKRYVFSNPEVWYQHELDDAEVIVNAGFELFRKLLELENYTLDDERNIRLILASSTKAEKQNIVSIEDWNICLQVISCSNWRILDEILASCFDSNDEKSKFKTLFRLSNMNEIKNIIINFIVSNERNEADFLLNWINLSTDQVNQLKREIIFSDCGKEAYLYLVEQNCCSFEEVNNRYFNWFNIFDEEGIKLKENLLCSLPGIITCQNLVFNNEFKRMCSFINFCLSTEESRKEFKKTFVDESGCYILKVLISKYVIAWSLDEEGDLVAIFDFFGGKWEEAEELLNWCFSSKEEIQDFKRNKFLKSSGAQIYFDLIICGEFEEAENFLIWLCLSDKEVKNLKEDTLYNQGRYSETLIDMLHKQQYDIVNFLSNQEAISIFLSCCLTGKEHVLEFGDLKYTFCKVTEDESVFAKFKSVSRSVDGLRK